MSFKSLAALPFALLVKRKMNKWINNPLETQERVFQELISKATSTTFGKDHNFISINSYEDFVREVPVRDYEELRLYVDRVVAGEEHVLWPEKPLFFAKTSGTTSGAKYIPITKESMPMHIINARNAIMCYIATTKKTKFVDGKMIFLQGSPTLSEKNGIKIGRLSGIVAHYVPRYLQKNRLPSWKTNCIEDWETKVDTIVKETINQDMSIISGIPSWVQMYFEKIIEKSGKPVGEVFKNLQLFIYGGVNFEPYRNKFENLLGRKVDAIELYPASEGFFAFQDSQSAKGMLLQLDSGIFYEFIKTEGFFDENPKRITLKDVELGVNYVMIISTTAGLWAYNVGDTIQFTSTKPYRIIVSGRIKHFISAFGEHVIGKEVEQALQETIKGTTIRINEFTVAPQITPKSGLPYHEWFIEFANEPEDMSTFITTVDKALQDQNSYYLDLITGKVLRPLVVTKIQEGGFQEYMKSIGKLGGQNKLPRLANDRSIADKLSKFCI